LYNKNAKNSVLEIDGEDFKYLFKVRRHKLGDNIYLKNFDDALIFNYDVINIDKKSASLHLKESLEVSKNSKYFELIWSIIDTKVIEKSLPFLNEIGVSKITFVYLDRSQKSFKINFERLKNILINSNQQCGRYDFMEFEVLDSLDNLLKSRDNIAYLDFGGDSDINDIKSILVGSEGGYTDRERELLKNHKKIGFKGNYILRSESASVAIASKVLL
jgi:16S rRNA (uracil1498-N3)-methyltransferase